MRYPKPRNGLAVSGLRHRARSSPLALRPAERRCPRRRDQYAKAGRFGRRRGVMDWIKGKVMIWAMNRAGAGVPSPNRIMLLRDADGDGVAETKSVFLEGLNSPFGMALIGDKLYVADTDALLQFDYQDGATEIAGAGDQGCRAAGGAHQLSLDEEPCRRARRVAPLCGHRLQQQCGRERARLGKGPRADPGDRSGDWRGSALRHRLAQSGRARLRAANRRAVGGGERAGRVGLRSRARLSHLGARTARSTAGRSAIGASMSTIG